MSPAFWQLDAAPLFVLSACAVTLATLGTFLVLRREAMLGDALAHAALPGLVLAWLATGSRAPLPMFVGALGAGLVTSLATLVVVRFGRVEPGSALGIVFTGLFAFGVLLIETTDARQVDLDVGCVLSGQLELLVWPGIEGARDLLWAATWRDVPHGVWTSTGVLALTLAWTLGARRAMALATFDRRFAATIGARPGWTSAIYHGLVTLAVVASFEAVGSILVVGLLVSPAATVRRAGGAAVAGSLGSLLFRSAALGLGTALLGYVCATVVGPLFGLGALDVAGTVAALGGLGYGLVALWSGRRDPK